MPSTSKWQPYAGIGLNYTTFFSESLSSEAKTGPTATSMSLDDSCGLAGQVGIDWDLGNNWLLNAAVWRIDINTEATKKTSSIGNVTADVDIDPWVYMISAGYKF